MIAYADSSVLVAWFDASDLFSEAVANWIERNSVEFRWNSILRAEVRHTLRKINTPYGRAAWNALRASEKIGHLSIGRERLDHLFEAADELSAEKAGQNAAGTWDFFHVAAAIHGKAECFATCDKLQAELAEATQYFRIVKLFEV
jgi:predicted nucleic acid-binding protein